MKIFMALFFLATSLAWSQEGLLNKLLAPGPLVKGHAELEKKDCLKCHAAGEGVPDIQCLSCHKELKPFVTSKKGFHGMVEKTCKECHSEHKGRDYNSIAVDENSFDHAKSTGYSLDGKHQELKCAECHKSVLPQKSVLAGKIRYFGNQSTCVSCHKKDDPHYYKGEWAKKDCIQCHSLKSWKEDLKFDHKKDAHYELEGKHAKMACAECHTPKNEQKRIVNIIYKWPALKTSQCLSCHKDHHKNSLSQKFRNGNCTTCHNQEEWKISDFDHKVTNYPLRSRHDELKCNECHQQKQNPSLATKESLFKFTGLKKDCLTCHKDYHFFKNLKHKTHGPLNNCIKCHNESTWKEVENFDHNQQTRYKIDGKHMNLNCLDCHIKKDKNNNLLGSIYHWPQLKTKNCETCHDSPHLREFSPALLKKACTECHVTSNWFDMPGGKKFDHSKTRFSITGAHETVSCSSCHGPQKKKIFKFKSPALKFCVDCHQNIHGQQFSKSINTNQCTTCHSTTNFTERLDFDHSKTRYPLEGSHKNLKCAECHLASKSQVLLTPPNIKSEKTNPSRSVAFTLSQFKFPHVKTTECLSCHVDYHQKQLDTTCLNCHTLESWKKTKFLHNKHSDFLLKYKHEQVKCSECHKPISGKTVQLKKELRKVTLYKPINQNCVSCHKDVHKGEFGNKCQECHSEKGWRTTKDFHKNFTLTGVHFSLECAECHKDNRKLAGISELCITCHAKDDVHSGSLPQCQECHRQQFWEVTGFKHSLTQFSLRGAHRTLDCMECHRNGTYKGLQPDCYSCHLQEALGVSNPNHTGFTNLNNCNECHLNQFSWRTRAL